MTVPRATCQVCERDIAVRVNGLVYGHLKSKQRCPGSAMPPAEAYAADSGTQELRGFSSDHPLWRGLWPTVRRHALAFRYLRRRKEVSMLLWLLVLILVIFAVAGGAAFNSLLWLILIIALVVAIFAYGSGRNVP